MAKLRRDNLKIVEESQAQRAAEASATEGVAALLRTARERTGLGLREVADALRIRYPYLEAIEQGRFGDLPGPTYALGFVRAYAEYLNLDGKEIVRRFKEEGQGVSRRTALVFPEPLQEGRFPGATVLVVALLIAGAVYGGWHYWQQRVSKEAGGVPPVPAELAPMAASKPAPQESPAPAPAPSAEAPSASASATVNAPAAATAAPAVSTPAPMAPAPAAATSGVASTASAPTAAPAPGTAASSSAPAATAPTASETPAPAAPAAPVAQTTTPVPAPKPAAAASTAAASSAAASAAPTSAAPTPGEPPAESLPAAPEQVAAVKANEPHIYGESNVNSRITLTAKQDSWVQLRDKESNVVWTRILRPGDSYHVPNDTGLVLLTGNAGALEVTVDGKPAPALGTLGAVRRNIPLDPDKLLAGQTGN